MNVLRTSKAESDSGNTRPPRSTLVFKPQLCSKSKRSSLLKRSYAPYKNLPLPGVFLINSAISALFVILQRPLPVMPIFLPTIFIFSNKMTRAPSRPAITAAIKPAAPPPMTMICFISYLFLTLLELSLHEL